MDCLDLYFIFYTLSLGRDLVLFYATLGSLYVFLFCLAISEVSQSH